MTVDEAVGAIAGAARGVPPEDQGLLDAALLAIDHADDRVRLDAARLLAASRDPRAHAALDARWADPRAAVATIAVRAAVMRDPAMVWHRFLPHIQAVLDRRTDAPLDEAIVDKLLYVCHGGAMPRRVDPDPLILEPRLLDLAARLRRHRTVGAAARMVLEAGPRGPAIAAISRYPYEPPLLARVGLPVHRDYLARYLAGEHGVWNEIVGQALAVAQHAELREEALAVACELMKRVRANVDALREVLRRAGAELPGEAPRARDAQLAPLVTRFGPLPVALEALWRVVGSIDLRPAGGCSLEADGLRLIALDPLALCGVGELSGAIEGYDDHVVASHVEIVGPFEAALAPDFLHKQDISGGPPYSVELPPRDLSAAVDPELDFERHNARLVDYLRICIRWGGFPGLEVGHRPLEDIALDDRIAFNAVSGPWGIATDRLLAQLRRDLVDF